MIISKDFSNIFFSLFFIVIFINLLSLIFGFYQKYLGYFLLLFITIFIMLYIRKNIHKLEKTVIILLYIIVFFIILFFLTASFFPQYMPFKKNEHEIKAEDPQIFNKLQNLYIDDPAALGSKMNNNEEDKIVRPIFSNKPFNAIFKPERKILSGSNITIILDLILNNTNGTNIYLDNKLIFPKLNSFELIYENYNDYIFANRDLSDHYKKEDLIKSGITEEFLYNNFPGADIWSTKPLDVSKVKAAKVKGYWPLSTNINTTFRGNFKLAIYVKNNLIISFVKQDLNLYEGKDEYSIIITNSKNEEIYTETFKDDGDESDFMETGQEQFNKIEVKDLDEDIYYISFIGNDKEDSSIKDIKINSNKVLILDKFLPITPFVFYKQINLPQIISFYYWHEKKDQTIIITGATNKNVSLDERWLSKKRHVNLSKEGDYYININKAYLWIESDYVSPHKENYFTIPVISSKKNPAKSNLIIIDKDLFNIKDKTIKYYKNLTFYNDSLKFQIQVDKRNVVYFDKINLKIS